MHGTARPLTVYAMGATGVAAAELGRPCEDTITLCAVWENAGSGARGVATYTSSWIAPKSDVHSQQRFHSMHARGEVTVDQAHRGFSVATDAAGYASPNPLFMKYTPSEGRFVGRMGYGYLSIEAFVAAAREIAAGRATARDFDASLATVHTTFQATAILEAGRRSLDADGAVMRLVYDDGEPGSPAWARPVDITPK